MKKLITILFAAFLAALPLTTTAQQKTIQKLLLSREYIFDISSGYTLPGICIGYTDGTQGYVPIEQVTIKGLDTSKKGLQHISVKYNGFTSKFTALITDKEYKDAVRSGEIRVIFQQNGINPKKITDYQDYIDQNPDLIWITKKDIKSVSINEYNTYHVGQKINFIDATISYANGETIY